MILNVVLVKMTSMIYGHLIYTKLTPNEDGVALLPGNISIGPFFMFQILFENNFQSFGYADVDWLKGKPVLRLKALY